jgi:protein TonB
LNTGTTLLSTEYPSIAVADLTKSSKIFWATICSMLLHGLLAYYLPNISFDEVKKTEPLKIELIQKDTPPAPLPTPEAPPEPVKPKLPEPKPIKQPKPLPVKELPIQTPEPIAPIANPPPPQTEVIAVTPKPEAPPSPVPHAPVVIAPPPPPPGPSEADLDDARSQYGHALWSAIEKHKNYPRIAQMRGWQGEAIVELILDGSGKLKSKKIISSSGYEVLDKQALDMIEKAAPFPVPPEVLRSSQFSIKVPVPFKLQD